MVVNLNLQATWTWEYRTPRKESCLTLFPKPGCGPAASIHACLTVKQRGKWCNQVLHFSKACCTCVHALMCAFRTDGKIKPFDVSPNGRGRLVAAGTELRPPESWGPKPWGRFFSSPSQPVLPSLLWSIQTPNHWEQHGSPLLSSLLSLFLCMVFQPLPPLCHWQLLLIKHTLKKVLWIFLPKFGHFVPNCFLSNVFQTCACPSIE